MWNLSRILLLLPLLYLVRSSTVDASKVKGEKPHWSYDDVDAWVDNYPDCGGQHQSPIDIDTNEAVVDEDLPILDRKLFAGPGRVMKIKNNGHTIVVPFERGGHVIHHRKLLPFSAKISQFHFHWAGAMNTTGSEHKLNGKQYFGELHAVYYNTKYKNIGEALDKPDGLAVFAWFIDVNYPVTNQNFHNLFDFALQGAFEIGDAMAIIPVSLESLLPSDISVYYRYKGSLTTPGCFESVIWTVFKKPIQIAKYQAHLMASAFSGEHGEILNDNTRPVQALNGRIVTRPPALLEENIMP